MSFSPVRIKDGSIDTLKAFSHRGLQELIAELQKWERTKRRPGKGCCPSEGASGLDLLLPSVGELTLWYRMSDAFTFPGGTSLANALHDSSAFPLPIGYVPHNLTYYERSTSPGWTTANRPTLGASHTEVGAADDGCMHFNYKQPAGLSTNNPGCYFQGPTNALSSFEASGVGGAPGQPAGKEMHTILCFFKIDPDANDGGAIIGNGEATIGTGSGGWQIGYQLGTGPTPNQLFFICSNSVSNFFMLTPGSLVRDVWYMVAVTRDVSTTPATWTLWVNGVAVATTTSAIVDHGYFGFTMGLTVAQAWPGAYDNFFKGYIDEIAAYSTLLTASQLRQIYQSGIGLTSEDGMVITKDGTGTSWAFPTTKVDGTRYDEIIAGTGLDSVDNTDGTVTLNVTATASDPSLDTKVWMPLTTTVGTDDVLVYDANHQLIPTLAPI